jgi:lipopolysaccharide biosynthesis glycosyltransferase
MGLMLQHLQDIGLYTRKIERRGEQLWDPISDAPMSTEFAISRFLVPHIVKHIYASHPPYGWAMFADSDILVRGNLVRLFSALDERKALYCVQHKHEIGGQEKMGGLQQTYYARKNWTSVMIFNVDHPANQRLTVEMVNTLPGRDLHALCWLNDDEIGELSPTWNWLVNVSPPVDNPQICHYTLGIPSLSGYESSPYADEWREELQRWCTGL